MQYFFYSDLWEHECTEKIPSHMRREEHFFVVVEEMNIWIWCAATGIARAVSPAGGFRNIQYGLNAAAAAVGSRTQPPPAAASSSAAAAASATSSSSSSGAVPVTSAAGAEATGADSNTVRCR